MTGSKKKTGPCRESRPRALRFVTAELPRARALESTCTYSVDVSSIYTIRLCYIDHLRFSSFPDFCGIQSSFPASSTASGARPLPPPRRHSALALALPTPATGASSGLKSPKSPPIGIQTPLVTKRAVVHRHTSAPRTSLVSDSCQFFAGKLLRGPCLRRRNRGRAPVLGWRLLVSVVFFPPVRKRELPILALHMLIMIRCQL